MKNNIIERVGAIRLSFLSVIYDIVLIMWDYRCNSKKARVELYRK